MLCLLDYGPTGQGAASRVPLLALGALGPAAQRSSRPRNETCRRLLRVSLRDLRNPALQLRGVDDAVAEFGTGVWGDAALAGADAAGPARAAQWASGYIEQLDPLSPTPRHPDQTPRQSSYGSEEAELKDTLRRLLHHDGYVPRKVGLEASGDIQNVDLVLLRESRNLSRGS